MFRNPSSRILPLKVISQDSTGKRRIPDIRWHHARQTNITRIRFSKCFSSRSDAVVPNLSVEDALNQSIKEGGLRHDPSQLRAAKRLSRLQAALQGYDNNLLLRKQLSAAVVETEKELPPNNENLTSEKNSTSEQIEDLVPARIKIPRGLYIYGEVGTGKSMLMDMFFRRTLIELDSRRRRCHFHSFMADIHLRIHQLKQKDLREKGRNFSVDISRQNNPIVRVAQQLASECLLLCLDEFQVTDIADAMILSQLFEELWMCGTVLVATSNRAPQHLYEGGLNREYFVPFVGMLERQCVIHEMKSNVDYRKLLVATASQRLGVTKHYFMSNNGGTSDAAVLADALFEELLNGREPRPVTLDVGFFGRIIAVKNADPEGLVARFSFPDLCERNVGAMDFRAIAEQFSILFVEQIPILRLEDPSQHDRARRFITLIDEAYEAKCALYCSTDSNVANPEELLVVDGIDFNLLSDSKSASVRELAFAFRRAASRITEMCSQSWWEKLLGVAMSQ